MTVNPNLPHIQYCPQTGACTELSADDFQKRLDGVRDDAAQLDPDGEIFPSTAELQYRIRHLERKVDRLIAQYEHITWPMLLLRLLRR